MRPAALACLAAALLLLDQAGALRAGPRQPEGSLNAGGCEKNKRRPNIIQIVTDDQARGPWTPPLPCQPSPCRLCRSGRANCLAASFSPALRPCCRMP